MTNSVGEKMSSLSVAIVSVNRAGHINQCNALCEALGWNTTATHTLSGVSRSDTVTRKVAIWTSSFLQSKKITSDLCRNPPSVVVYSGNTSLQVAKAVRHRLGGRIIQVFVGAPRGKKPVFDFACVSRHALAENTHDDPHQFPAAGTCFFMDGVMVRPVANDASRAVTAVLVGGINKAFDLDFNKLDDQLNVLLAKGQELAFAFSRRTPSELESLLRQRFPSSAFVDRSDRQNFLALLNSAQSFVVTPDSINMICEAVSTMRPVGLFDLPVRDPSSTTFKFVRRFSELGHVQNVALTANQNKRWLDCEQCRDALLQFVNDRMEASRSY